MGDCTPQVFISLECAPNQKTFQLIKHFGKYNQPKTEFNEAQNMIICSYRSNEWVSQYRYVHGHTEKILNVTNLEDLANVVNIIRELGFKVDHFGNNSYPFSMLTYKEEKNQYLADEIFLFSGLESTFENNNFGVKARDKKMVSTVVINERYLKSQDVTADTFETGSNCIIQIK